MYTLSIEAKTYEELQEKIAKLNRNNIYGKMETIVNDEKIDKRVKDLLEDAQPIKEEPPLYAHGEASTFVSANKVMNEEVDSAGMPHDPRIHSETKTKLKTGVWRLKKGLDAEVFEKVTKEIMTPVIPVVIPPPPPVTTHVEMPVQAAPPQTASPATLLQPETKKYEAIPVPVQQGVRPAHTCASFMSNLMPIIADLINQGKIDQNYIEELKKYFGVKEIWNITASGKQTQELYETFAKCGFITAVD